VTDLRATPLHTLRLQLALLVAHPDRDALLLTASNEPDGWVPVHRAATSGRAYAIQVAFDMFAVDDDAHSAALDVLVAEIRATAARPVLVASGREGHRHLFARDALRQRWIARARELGLPDAAIRIDHNLIRPPLAPHRLGLPVRLLDPTDPVEALVALAPRGERPRRLSRRMYALLRDGR